MPARASHNDVLLGPGEAVDGVFPRRLGSYVLLSHLGPDGTEGAYLALSRERGRERLTVIKRFGNPRAQFTAEQVRDHRRRFWREAKITMALAHPSIARTFAHLQSGTDAYLVQEFVHGASLAYLAASMAASGQRCPIPVAAAVACKLAGALDYIHEFRGLGLLHRDLTPSNVMVSQDGEIKIIDFGIATTLAGEGPSKPHVIGAKPWCAPPEIQDGARPDRRADLYALGLIFWTLLAGREPDDSLLDDVFLRLPSAFNSAVPLELDEIVSRAIDPRPDRRFQTARAFRDAVMSFASPSAVAEEVLALLLARCPPVFEKRYLDEVVARGRPLLDSNVARGRWRPFAVAAALSLVGILAARAALHGRRSHPPPSLGAMREARLLSPSAPPPASAQVDLAKVAGPFPETSSSSPSPTLPRGSHAAGRPAKTPPSQPPLASPAPAVTVPCPENQSGASSQSAEELLGAAFDALARSEKQQALELARASLHRRETADAYILVGRILFESDPESARAALDAALRLSPSSRQAARLLDDLRARMP